MSKVPICINPVLLKESEVDPTLGILLDLNRKDHVNQVLPYQLDIEITDRCAGACIYCYSSSTPYSDQFLSREKVFSIIDEAPSLGFRLINFLGGCPLLHPDWAEFVTYAAEKGVQSWLCTSSVISKKAAQKICELRARLNAITSVICHIDTINQEVYNIVHNDPRTLQAKIQGYRNLLEEGFPADKIIGCITVTKPVLDVLEETVDWFVDEMGCRAICYVQFKANGFGVAYPQWEPNLSDIKRTIEYRAKKLGPEWLRIGSSDGSFFVCRTEVVIQYDGSVVPCTQLRDLVMGNIYTESLTEILDKNRDELLFNYPIKGYCGSGECDRKDYCFGCRANAYHYLGNERASDPKCYLNPEAKEYCYPR